MNSELLTLEQIERVDKMGRAHLGFTEKEELQYMYSKGYYDIGYFAETFLKEWKRNKKTLEFIVSPDFHEEIWDNMRNTKNSAVIVPRDHAKTTCSRIFCVWSICYKFDVSILIFTPEDLGVETIGKIREVFSFNFLINKIFGNLVPGKSKQELFEGKKWKDSLLQFSNGCQIQCVTKNGSVRGKRPTFLLVDDPQEIADVANDVQAKKFANRFWTATYNVLEPSGRCCALGTVISSNCLMKEIEGKEVFKTVRYQAISKVRKIGGKIVGGIPLWPGLWSLEALEERRMVIGDGPFDQEYMNIAHDYNHKPVFGKSTYFEIVKPIRTIDDIEFYCEPCDDLVIGADTAEGGIDGDYSTFVGRKRNGELAFIYRGKVPEDVLGQKVNRVFELGYSGIFVPEANKSALLISTIKEFWWFEDHIYQRTDELNEKETESAKYGLYMTASLKRQIIGEYDVVLRCVTEKQKQSKVSDEVEDGWHGLANTRSITCWQFSEVLRDEVKSYAYDDKMRANAVAGYNDDTLISDMLCNQARKKMGRMQNVSLEDLGLK